jgi:hypothetical protein
MLISMVSLVVLMNDIMMGLSTTDKVIVVLVCAFAERIEVEGMLGEVVMWIIASQRYSKKPLV